MSASVVISVDIHLNYTQWEVKQSNKLNEVDSEERSSREVTGTSAWVFIPNICLEINSFIFLLYVWEWAFLTPVQVQPPVFSPGSCFP